jgi:hypothetical protein
MKKHIYKHERLAAGGKLKVKRKALGNKLTSLKPLKELVSFMYVFSIAAIFLLIFYCFLMLYGDL